MSFGRHAGQMSSECFPAHSGKTTLDGRPKTIHVQSPGKVLET